MHEGFWLKCTNQFGIDGEEIYSHNQGANLSWIFAGSVPDDDIKNWLTQEDSREYDWMEQNLCPK